MFDFDLIKSLFHKHTLGKGLDPLPSDPRDGNYDLGIFGWGEYVPKHDEVELPSLTTKLQKNNTCGWTASAGAKEIDEGVVLSMRGFVALGRKLGLISRDGFSNLRDNEDVLQKYGIPEEAVCPSCEDEAMSWEEYSNPVILTPEVMANAAKHKSGTYWRVYKVDQIYKALDEGHPVKVGISWRTAFNMAGGFSFPFLLNFLLGSFVGGHATYCKGYRKNFADNIPIAIRIKNSFGIGYGDHGDFWIRPDDLLSDMNKYGSYLNIDLDRDMAKFLNESDGFAVKDVSNPDEAKKVDVYYILEGQKHYIPDVATLMAHGIDETTMKFDIDGMLRDVTTGEPLSFWMGKNVLMIKQMLQKKADLKPIFKTYFNELLSL